MEYHTEPVTMWFDRRLVMRQSSIHGVGTFASGSIREGERLIWVSGGIVYTTEDWRTGKVQLEPCRCGSELCRGRVTGSDWKLPDVQQRYRGYFTPYIERLIRAVAAQ